MKRFLHAIVLAVVLVAGCGGGGGGGGGGGNGTATLYLFTYGTASEAIRGATVAVTLPPGVNVSAADIVGSGGAPANASVQIWENTPSTATTAGRLYFSVITSSMTVGEYVTVKCTTAPGVAVQASQFALSNKAVTSVSGAALSNVDIIIGRFQAS